MSSPASRSGASRCWFELQSYYTVDFEEAAYQYRLVVRAAKRAAYLETKLLDPATYRAQLAQIYAKRTERPGYKARLRGRDIRELREMYRLGVPVKTIAKAFNVCTTTVQRALRGAYHVEAGGYVHDARKRARGERVRVVRGADHPNAGKSPLNAELVARVLSMSGSSRAVGRATGIHHTHVSRIRRGLTWVQRAEAAE